MKRQNRSIALAASVAGLVGAFVAFGDGQASASKTDDTSGRGATQKWVLMKIAESETNTMAKVDAKLNTLVAQLDSTIEANMTLLKDETNTNAVRQATQNCIMSASPVADYILNSAF